MEVKNMDVRFSAHPEDVKSYDAQRLRREFLLTGFFEPDRMNLFYSHVDRMISGGVCPIGPVELTCDPAMLGTEVFLERREMGILNLGGPGKVEADGTSFELERLEALYLGMGTVKVTFSSTDASNPARFYLISAPPHAAFPCRKIGRDQVVLEKLGSVEDANVRTIRKYIHPAVLDTCQLSMGVTTLEKGSVWNTMPVHTHERRMEVYFYFDIDEDSLVFHLMGQPSELRHIVVRNEEAVISPSWSIHSGVGTRAYSFIWGMAGENKTFTDMDGIPMKDLR
jgi:4-deoxy-L-threo-5-hexosulose-uronate ketol-isomerase